MMSLVIHEQELISSLLSDRALERGKLRISARDIHVSNCLETDSGSALVATNATPMVRVKQSGLCEARSF